MAMAMLLTLPGFAQKAGAPAKASSVKAATVAQERGDRLLSGLPLLFEQNRGQREQGISFIANANGYRLALAPSGATFALHREKEAPVELHMSLKGANPKAETVGLDEVPAKTNYLFGKDPSKWITKVPNFERIAVRDALPGVDVFYYGNDRQLEYDFNLAAGVDPYSVVLNFGGSSGLKLDTAGDLVIATSAGEVKLKRPVAYQNGAGPGSPQTPVQVSYLLKNGGDIGFRVEAYDHARPLVIDPVLQYVSFFSGVYTPPDFNEDTVVIMGMATDNSGNSYIYGYDPGQRLGAGATTTGSCPAGGCINVFVMKFNPNLSGAASLVYTTLIPAVAAEDLQANALGDAYGPYATYGSVVGDDGNNAFFPSFALALDTSGDIYITGSTDNPNYPTTASGYEPSCNMNPNDPLLEYCVPAAYISKISPDGTTMLYSTFMNAGAPFPAPSGFPQFGITTFPSIGFGIVADNSQKVYVAIDTAAGFPVTNGLPCSYTDPFGNVPECNSAAMVKLDTTVSGSAGLIYSEEFEQLGDTTSGFGGPAFFLETDGVGDAYATAGGCYALQPGIGLTPIPLNGYDTALPAPAAPCWTIMKLDTSGNVAYATYFSPFASFDDQTLQIGGITADPDGTAYVEGIIEPATDLPIAGNGYLFTVPDAATTLYAGQFVTGFDTTKTGADSLVYSSALEGVQPETRTQIASNGCGSVAITGDLDSAAFPFVYPLAGAIESSNLSSYFPPFAAVLNTRLPGQAGLIFSSSLYTNPDFQVSMSNLSLNQQGNLSLDGFLLADTITSDYATFPTANAYQNSPSVPAGIGPAPFFQVIQGAVTPGCINIAPLTLAFGNEPVGSTTATQPITLTNTSGSTLTISSIEPSAGFTESDNCGTALVTNASCTVNAAFSPTTAEAQTGTLTFTNSDIGSPQVVALTGTGTGGTPEPLAVLAPATAFGSLTEGTSSPVQGILLSNSGNATLNINGIAITGLGAPSFSETDNCGTSLAAGANCTINVTFTPAAVGPLSATLSVVDNASNTPQTDPLTGTGTAPLIPQAVLSPANLLFPNTTVGATAMAQLMTLSNPGNAALTITGITISGANPTDFAETTTCGGTLAPGAKCSISLTFTPASAASFLATVSVADNAANTPQTATLSGTGTAPPAPQAVLSPTSVAFPSTTVGSSAAAQSITLSNPGNATLNITGITINGASPTDFAETTTCGSTLAAGASCSLAVTFTPTTAVSFSATVSVTDNAAGSPQTTAISGTGVAPPPAPDFSVTSPTAAQTIQPGASAQYSIAVASLSSGSPFTNAVALTVSGLPPGASASFNSASVTPGSSDASSTLTVQTAGIVASGTRNSSSPPGIRQTPWYLTTASMAFLCLSFIPLRKRWPPKMAVLVAVAFGALCAAGLSGCGGGFALPAKSTTSGSPVTYTITVTGTSGTDQHSTSVTLTVE